MGPGSVLRFLLLGAAHLASRRLFRFVVERVGPAPARPFRDCRVAVLLNHTSLWEPIFLGIVPLSWIWEVARRGLLPGADSTLRRPLAGLFFRWMVPQAVSVSRRRDRTWADFGRRLGSDSIVIIAPEGRMKRRDGLDKNGRPMTVRGGIVDILNRVGDGTLLIVYSGGLHHVQAPDEGWPRLFQTVRARVEEIPIARYRQELGFRTPAFRANVIADLERRRDRYCRWD